MWNKKKKKVPRKHSSPILGEPHCEFRHLMNKRCSRGKTFSDCIAKWTFRMSRNVPMITLFHKEDARGSWNIPTMVGEHFFHWLFLRHHNLKIAWRSKNICRWVGRRMCWIQCSPHWWTPPARCNCNKCSRCSPSTRHCSLPHKHRSRVPLCCPLHWRPSVCSRQPQRQIPLRRRLPKGDWMLWLKSFLPIKHSFCRGLIFVLH